MTGADPDDTAAATAEYCRTQAGLLAGRVDTTAEEAHARLTEIDEGVAELRDRLSEHPDGTSPTSTESPRSTGPVDDAAATEPGDADEFAELAAAESSLAEKQAAVEATQTRMRLFRDLADEYLELADSLLEAAEAGEIDGDEAVERVVSFEADRDAPAFFDERETFVELARRGTDDDG
jgi:hypothetical protein